MAQGGGLSGFEWPESCGDFEMRIAANGTWFYKNSPIGRLKLVQLFATTLNRDENGQYWLVTPFERGLVEVEDAPFVIEEMRLEQKSEEKTEQELYFRTNLGHWVRLDEEHSLSLRISASPQISSKTPRFYVHIRDGLDALINRSVYYELIELAEMSKDSLFITSAGVPFSLGSLEENSE